MIPDTYLIDLISALRKMPQEAVVPDGFGEMISIMDGNKVIFERDVYVKISDMLKYSLEALADDFVGYYCNCFISHDCDDADDKIGVTLIGMWESYAEDMKK